MTNSEDNSHSALDVPKLSESTPTPAKSSTDAQAATPVDQAPKPSVTFENLDPPTLPSQPPVSNPSNDAIIADGEDIPQVWELGCNAISDPSVTAIMIHLRPHSKMLIGMTSKQPNLLFPASSNPPCGLPASPSFRASASIVRPVDGVSSLWRLRSTRASAPRCLPQSGRPLTPARRACPGQRRQTPSAVQREERR